MLFVEPCYSSLKLLQNARIFTHVSSSPSPSEEEEEEEEE
jgi:hypothetical protein